jgi:hypothetical protein
MTSLQQRKRALRDGVVFQSSTVPHLFEPSNFVLSMYPVAAREAVRAQIEDHAKRHTTFYLGMGAGNHQRINAIIEASRPKTGRRHLRTIQLSVPA